MKRGRACPICGSTALQAMLAYAPSAKFNLLRATCLRETGCKTCGIVFQDPMPSQEQLDSYYAEDTGWETQCSTRNTSDSAQLSQRLYRLLAKELSNEQGMQRGRVFDFGCGYGSFLDSFKEAGWQTYGFEPGPQGRQAAERNHHMFDSPPETGDFDLVVIRHVIEHLREPLKILTELRRLIRPGGFAYVGVPDLGRLREHRNLQNIFNGAHVFAFTSGSLANMLYLAGYSNTRTLDSSEWDQSDVLPSDPNTRRLRMFGAEFGTANERGASNAE